MHNNDNGYDMNDTTQEWRAVARVCGTMGIRTQRLVVTYLLSEGRTSSWEDRDVNLVDYHRS
jgi:hypothetical protein